MLPQERASSDAGINPISSHSGPHDEEKDLEKIAPTFTEQYYETADISTRTSAPVYKVYKRRFLGLLQLVLLNIVISWDVCFDT